MTSRIVPDASAIVALLIAPGEEGEAAATGLAGRQLHAPSHLPVEVANVLRRRANGGLLSRTEADLAFSDLWRLTITLWPFETVAERAWNLGATVSSYDAAYVALAERLRCPLATLDRRLAAAPGPKCEFAVL
ncbi:MAG: type II toxin-antitoxin system VapC family toxin [Pseudoclavibacter sp.]